MLYHIDVSSIDRIQKHHSQIAHIIVIATRPDIIKQAPIYHELKKRGELVILCHTDQHFDSRHSGGFVEEFGLEVDIHLGIDGSLHNKYSQMIDRFGEVIGFVQKCGKTPIPYIHGDTATAIAVGLGSILRRVACVHIEAGIRTLTPKAEVYGKFYNDFQQDRFDWERYYQTMQIRDNFELGSLEPYPEQINTRMAESASGFYAAPQELNKGFLISEGFLESRIAVVGNSIADSVIRGKENAENARILRKFPQLMTNKYIPFLIHRRENTEDENRFRIIIGCIRKLLEDGFSVYLISLLGFEAALDCYGLRDEVENWIERYPDSFLKTLAIACHQDMLAVMLHSPVVVTDSGSMQEELNILGVPDVTVRFGSDRSETFLAGANIPAPPIDSGFMAAIIKGSINHKGMESAPNLYGNDVAKKVVDEVLKHIHPVTGLFNTEEQRLNLNLTSSNKSY